jgi:hypothetical protein
MYTSGGAILRFLHLLISSYFRKTPSGKEACDAGKKIERFIGMDDKATTTSGAAMKY